MSRRRGFAQMRRGRKKGYNVCPNKKEGVHYIIMGSWDQRGLLNQVGRDAFQEQRQVGSQIQEWYGESSQFSK